MQKINGYPKNLVTLLGSRYFIPYYQREYKWEKKQMLELVEDLSDEFLNNYQVDHGLKDVDRYGMYFRYCQIKFATLDSVYHVTLPVYPVI